MSILNPIYKNSNKLNDYLTSLVINHTVLRELEVPMVETLKLLEDFLAEGFCLHGSRTRIEGLVEPRQACDMSGRKSGCQLAVYADPDDVRIPCVMAMRRPVENPQPGLRPGGYQLKGRRLCVYGDNATFGPGFVYALPRTTFCRLDDEFVSFEPVAPHAVVPVTPAILLLFKNVELRIPIPTSW